MTRTPRMLLAAAGATVLAVLATGAPALAHVTVSAPKAVQGGYARVAVSVPNESDTAATVKVELFMPEQTPIASVRTTPIAGWTAVVEKGKPAVPLESHGTPVTEVVTKITWTAAAGGGVKPGEFAEFPLSMGPLPNAPRLVFKALQTYSDGNVARWIEEPPAAGGEEPESPAPVLALAAATGADPAATGVSVQAAAPGPGDEESGSGPALGLGIAGLVAGLAGLALGALAFARTRRQHA